MRKYFLVLIVLFPLASASFFNIGRVVQAEIDKAYPRLVCAREMAINGTFSGCEQKLNVNYHEDDNDEFQISDIGSPELAQKFIEESCHEVKKYEHRLRPLIKKANDDKLVKYAEFCLITVRDYRDYKRARQYKKVDFSSAEVESLKLSEAREYCSKYLPCKDSLKKEVAVAGN